MIEDYEFQLLKEALQTLLDYEGEFENPASQGITTLILSESSMPELSDLQKHVFTKFIEPPLNQTCGRCGENVPYEELTSYYEEGMCGYCVHMMHKTMDD